MLSGRRCSAGRSCRASLDLSRTDLLAEVQRVDPVGDAEQPGPDNDEDQHLGQPSHQAAQCTEKNHDTLRCSVFRFAPAARAGEKSIGQRSRLCADDWARFLGLPPIPATTVQPGNLLGKNAVFYIRSYAFDTLSI